jgi:hypothetical protein
MRCNFEPTGEVDDRGWRKWRCSREKCQQPTDWTPDEASNIHARCKVIGWGDYLTYWLALFGLTKQRIEWITRKPCGCEERQEKLNTWGERLRAWWLTD